MAKLIYLGGSNTSLKIEKVYVSDGTARKVKKAYIGDGSGKARLFYSSGYRWNRYEIITTYFWNQCNYTTNITHDIQYQYVSNGRFTSRTVNYTCTTLRLASSGGRFDRLSYATVDGVDAGDWFMQNTGGPAYHCTTPRRVNNTDMGYIGYDQIATITDNESISVGSVVGEVSSTSSSTYPNGGVSGSYYYYRTRTEQSKGSIIDTIEAESENAYPDNGISGDYWYEKIT